jgi:hypothetical protein
MWPGSQSFTVGPETTYVTGPLDKDGYVDYVTALNERLRQGITPENNANVLIWQALGPWPGRMNGMPPEHYHWLGIESPPEKGDYLITWRNYLNAYAANAVALDDQLEFERLQLASFWPWLAKEEPEIADWLKRNEKPLALVIEASRRPDYYNPMVPKRTEDGWEPLIEALLPNVQLVREFARALVCRAMLRTAEGKFQEAWLDLLTCQRLGRLVARGGTGVELLVGFANEALARQAEIAILSHARLTPKQILAHLEELRKLPPMPTVADKVDLAERFVLLDTMMMLVRRGPANFEGISLPKGSQPPFKESKSRLFTHSINWDPAFRNANQFFDRYVAALRLPDRTARWQEVDAILQELQLLRQKVTDIGAIEKEFMGPSRRGEMIGNVMIGMMAPGFDKLQNAAERREQDQRNLYLAFVLAAYHNDHGSFPAKLDDLVPNYLAKVPDDLFSGKPLIYRLEGKGYLLYSIGPNGIDERGRGFEDEPHGDDLSVRMPMPKPRENR